MLLEIGVPDSKIPIDSSCRFFVLFEFIQKVDCTAQFALICGLHSTFEKLLRSQALRNSATPK